MDKELDEMLNFDVEEDDDEELFDVIVLEDDTTGDSVECVVLDRLVIEGVQYLLVMDSSLEEEEEPEVLFLREEGTEGDFQYTVVEDDKEFEKVSKIFAENADDMGGDYEFI